MCNYLFSKVSHSPYCFISIDATQTFKDGGVEDPKLTSKAIEEPTVITGESKGPKITEGGSEGPKMTTQGVTPKGDAIFKQTESSLIFALSVLVMAIATFVY